MTSIERILDLMKLKPEPLESGQLRAAVGWPEHGRICFEQVSFSYGPDLPLVLKDLTVTFEAGEKVGVVGRTGAGWLLPFLHTLYSMPNFGPRSSLCVDYALI